MDFSGDMLVPWRVIHMNCDLPKHRNSGFSPVSLLVLLGLTIRQPWHTVTVDHEGYYGSLHTHC